MATLSADVQTRYGAQFLINLTNSDVPAGTASTLNTTRLDAAADDIEGHFRTYAGVTYDSTDARHVAIAVDGVVRLLKLRGPLSNTEGADLFASWLKSLKLDLGAVTGRNRIVPKSNAETQTETEITSTETLRPKFDWRSFEDVQLNDPR